MAGEGEGQNSEGNSEGEGQSQSDSQNQETQSEWKAPASQEEFDRMVQTRIKRVENKYADYKDLKTKASKFDELDAASKSELEKEREARTAAEAKAQAAEERAKSVALRSAVISEATKQGAVDPDAVLKLIDTGELEMDDNGNISGLSGAVTALLEAKKYLKGKQFTGSADGGKRDENSGSFTRKQISDPSFYQAHEKEILLAMRQGGIKD
jgi:hypothetical protein